MLKPQENCEINFLIDALKCHNSIWFAFFLEEKAVEVKLVGQS